MSNELQQSNSQDMQPVELQFGTFRNPEVALKEAELVAIAFRKRANQLELYKQIGSSKHLLVEGWQMLASMYRITASVTSTKFIDLGNGTTGWEATAEAVYIPSGQTVSRADAMCLSDEDNWGPRPKYEWTENGNGKRVKTLIGMVPTPTQQLRSMAQTRACSKVYSNLLKFVARMAGFAGTPGEEMTGDEPSVQREAAAGGQQQHGGGGEGPQRSQQTGPVISEPQAKRFYAIIKKSGRNEDQIKAFLARFGFSSSAEITRALYEKMCADAEKPDPPAAAAAQQPAAQQQGSAAPASGAAAPPADKVRDEWIRKFTDLRVKIGDDRRFWQALATAGFSDIDDILTANMNKIYEEVAKELS